ncbi:hypothetical protein SAMN04488109_5993 [Chryseolinea serpens]|uniref:Uncharacterized protein n=1 Tax=Chryseolinea serpens TaxID=947013 RepID=A0A1M5WT54_9BACT|nr:hypothetical protein SAMN04488109_5993 [Chryseolinea serpens]
MEKKTPSSPTIHSIRSVHDPERKSSDRHQTVLLSTDTLTKTTPPFYFENKTIQCQHMDRRYIPYELKLNYYGNEKK